MGGGIRMICMILDYVCGLFTSKITSNHLFVSPQKTPLNPSAVFLFRRRSLEAALMSCDGLQDELQIIFPSGRRLSRF